MSSFIPYNTVVFVVFFSNQKTQPNESSKKIHQQRRFLPGRSEYWRLCAPPVAVVSLKGQCRSGMENSRDAPCSPPCF